LTKLLKTISENEEETKMSEGNLGIIFGPTISFFPDASFSTLNLSSGFVVMLIENYDAIFGMREGRRVNFVATSPRGANRGSSFLFFLLFLFSYLLDFPNGTGTKVSVEEIMNILPDSQEGNEYKERIRNLLEEANSIEEKIISLRSFHETLQGDVNRFFPRLTCT